MSAQHTPGPWGWVYDGSGDYSIGEVDDPQGKPVAGVYAYGGDDDKATANCRLLAASTDLLYALEGLTPILEAAESNASGNPEWAWVSKRINAARAAIGKARGAA